MTTISVSPLAVRQGIRFLTYQTCAAGKYNFSVLCSGHNLFAFM